MFRPVKKKVNEMSLDSAKELLRSSRRGILAVNGDDGYPYAIPINYFYDEDAEKIYFHGARTGHKVDALKACDKICFTVYGNEQQTDITWAPKVQSAVIFGRCHLLENNVETMEVLKTFALKYYPGLAEVNMEISHSGKAVQLFEITIEHMSGKEVQEK